MSRQKKYKMKAILDKGEPTAPKSAITRVFSEGHEGEADTLSDGTELTHHVSFGE